MAVTAASLILVSVVLGLEIVELWSKGEDGRLMCIYVHAINSVVEDYPDIIVGYYPEHKREHIISPAVSYSLYPLRFC